MAIVPKDAKPAKLFNLISEGNEMAFKVLFEQYKSKTYAVAFKWTKSALAAEDITQEVFISVWISKAQLPLVKDPSAYLYTVIYNTVKRYLKKDEHQKRILQLPFWNVKKFSNDTEETIQANECRQLIEQALAKLTPQKRLIFTLNRQHGKTCTEIGGFLNLSPHTVKSHLQQAVKFVRNHLQDKVVLMAAGLVKLFF